MFDSAKSAKRTGTTMHFEMALLFNVANSYNFSY